MKNTSGATNKTLSNAHTSSTHHQITPPPTPRSARDSTSTTRSRSTAQSRSQSRLEVQPQLPQPPSQLLFMRAFYAFNPPYNPDSTTVTLPLSVGDIVMIHNVHVNGWADGTTLGTGGRGWLPTNYC